MFFFLQVLEPSPLELTTGAAKKSKVRGTLLFSLPVSKRPPGPSPVGFFYFTSDFRCFFSPFYLVVSDWTCLYLYFTQYFQIRPTFTFFAVLQNFYSILYASILSCMQIFHQAKSSNRPSSSKQKKRSRGKKAGLSLGFHQVQNCLLASPSSKPENSILSCLYSILSRLYSILF